jgi:hypothetical protein
VKVTVDLVLPVEAVGVARAAPGIAAGEASEAKVVVLLPLGVTMNVYDVPLVRPVTVQFCAPVGAVTVLTTVQVKLPGVDVTVYVEATPSATNATFTVPLPLDPMVGVAKAAKVVTDVDAVDREDVVLLPVGLTWKVYAVPAVSPVTVQFCDPVGAVTVLTTVQVKPPGVEVTV